MERQIPLAVQVLANELASAKAAVAILIEESAAKDARIAELLAEREKAAAPAEE